MDLLDQKLLINNLLQSLEDTYESNQQKALQLLHTIPKGIYDKYTPDSKLSEILKKAFKYLHSSQTENSMFAAYLFLSSFVDSQRSLIVLNQLKESSEMEELFEGLVIDDPTESYKEQLAISLVGAVLQVLKHQVKRAQQDLVLASQESPLYPALMSIRYLLREAVIMSTNKWSNLIQQLFDVIHEEIQPVVGPVVCHSSPEGYMPTNEEGETDYAGEKRPGLPQYLVVCCWRTVKEISLVYGTLMEKVVPSQPNIVSKIQVCQYIKSFYEYILLKAKHRGAFEMAYTGYCSYWHTVWKLQSCQDLVAGFLTDSPYSMLLSRTSADSLCATRRSAGIPFMVQAYVSSEPKLNNHATLEVILNTLLPMSFPSLPDENGEQMYSQVQRVHALNVLRALYRASTLGNAVQHFVAQGLKSAITGYKSQVWPVRNASTLLFSAVITRMFGVKHGKDDLSKQSGMAGRLFFQRYPEIHPFLVQELEMCTEFSSSGQTLLQPSLYLILIVLCKLYPSQKDSMDSNLSLDGFVKYLYRCASSPVYKARKLSALALANILNHSQVTTAMEYLCKGVSTRTQHNKLHGNLLQIYHLYLSLSDVHFSQVGDVIAEMLRTTYRSILHSQCELIKASYIDVVRITKVHLYEKYPDIISNIIQASLHGAGSTTHTVDDASERPTSPSYNWSTESVDLQMSRCRLLLDTNQPFHCTRDSLVELLADGSMYEVHHEILSSFVSRDEELLLTTDLVHVLCERVKLNNLHLSYKTTHSIDMVSDILSDRCTKHKENESLLTEVRSILVSLEWEQTSLSILRLQSCLIQKGSSLLFDTDQILDQLLNYLKGDEVDTRGLTVSIEILKLVSQYLFNPLALKGSVPQSYWIACVLLIFSYDEHIRSVACTAIKQVMLSQRRSLSAHCDPHSTVSQLLDWMSTVYDGKTTKDTWDKWLSSPQIWLPHTTVELEDAERPFSKAADQLLCDPQGFYRILKQHINSHTLT